MSNFDQMPSVLCIEKAAHQREGIIGRCWQVGKKSRLDFLPY